MAASGSWQELRASNRELGLLLLFTPTKHRDVCADIILLGFELDNAIHIPSEVMLAAIRLQWWRDAIMSEAPSTVPLINRLQAHMNAQLLTRDQLIGMIDSWQDRLGDSDLDPRRCWGVCWHLMAAILPGHNAGTAALSQDKAAEIGRQCMTLLMAPERRLDDPQPVTSAGLPPLFTIAAALIGHWQKNPTADSDDPLLIWRMLGWKFGFTPR